MKLFAKRALILSIFVLAIFALTMLGASAAGTEYAGDTAAVEAGAVARIGEEGGAGYYTDLPTAISEAAGGDTITVLKDTALTATDITNKDITIVGSDKHTITVASGAGYAFKLLGTEASLTVNNLVLDVTQTGKNTNAYMFGTSGSTAGTYALTLDNVDTIWLNGSGAIYGYGSIAATISLTDCSFEGGVALINTTANATNVTMHLDNVTRVGSVLEVHTDSANRVAVTRASTLLEYASDAEAIAADAFFRISATEGGNVYCKALVDAINEVQAGNTIYVLADATAADIILSGKSITLEGVGTVTLNGGGSTTALFTLDSGASLTLKKLSFTMGAKKLVLAQAGANTVTMENVNVTADAGIYVVHVNATGALAEVTVTNGTFTAGYLTFVNAGSLADLDVTGATLKCSIYRTEASNGVFGSATDPVTLTDVILDHNNGTSSGGFTFREKTTAYIAIVGGRYNLRSVDYNSTTVVNAGSSFITCRDGTTPVINVTINKNSTKSTEFHMGSWSSGTNQPYANFLSINAYGVTISGLVFDANNASFKAYSNVSEMFTFKVSKNANTGVTGTVSGKLSFANCSFDTPGRIFTLNNADFTNVTNCTRVSGTLGTNNLEGSFGADADAVAFGFKVRVGELGATPFYYTDVYEALAGAPTDNGAGGATNVYLLGSVTQRACHGDETNKFQKKVHITSVGDTTFTLTLSSYGFYFGDGAELTYTNVTVDMKNRFARVDGDFKLVFGSGCTVKHANAIFLWNKGDGGAAVYTIEILNGAVINATTAFSNALFYHNSTAAAGSTVTLTIAGTINTNNSPVVKDVNENGSYTIYYDARTAIINTGTASWMASTCKTGVLFYQYANFETMEAGAAWGHATGAYGMTYNNDPEAEWKYSFTYGAQFLPNQFDVLGTHGGEVWQLRTVASIYTTVYVTNKGTVALKPYNGATITLQDVCRIRVQSSTLILDGISLTINSTSNNGAGCIGIHGGTAEAPSVLKLVNGAAITGPAWAAGQMIYFRSENGGDYSHLYVDETSSITQTAPASEITNNTYIIWIHDAWDYGSITVKGTISSAAEVGGKTSLISATGSGNGCTVLIDGGTLSVPETDKTVYTVEFAANFNGMLKFTGDMPEHTTGMTMRVGDKQYFASLTGAITLGIPAGGEDTVTLLTVSTFNTPITLENKKVTVVGLDDTVGDTTYDLSYTGGDYMFNIYNLAGLTFQNINFKTGRPLISYRSTALTTVAQDDKDITISFINSYLDYNGSSRFIVSNNHGDSAAGTQCDTFTFNVDETSTVSWVANSTDARYMFYFHHSSHKYIVMNIDGTISFKDHVATATNEAMFFESNNPSAATINFSETAKLIIDIADPIAADRIFYFTTGTNKLTIHENAILDENGDLTLSGMRLFRQFSAGAAPATVIVANSDANEATWLDLLGEDKETNAFSIIKYRANVDGVYYYANVLSTAVARLDDMESTGGLYLWANGSVSTGLVLDGVEFSLAAAEGVTLTSSAARLFTLTNGARLTVEDLVINITSETVDAATNGGLVAVADAEATAKVSATLTNVTVTGSKSILFYFGGESEADVEITGGDYSAKGIFSFGNYVNADEATNAKVNLTVTGTDEDHVALTSNGREVILLKISTAASVNKDNVQITFNYVDASATDADVIYVRGTASLTYTHNYGSVTAAGNMVLTTQGGCAPYFTYNNVTLTRNNNGFVMRPYGGSGCGAYVTMNNCVIEAPATTGQVFGASDVVDVTLTGCVVNAAKATTVFGSNSNNSSLIYTADGCTFNISDSATIGTSPYRVIVKGETQVLVGSALVALSAANAASKGLAFLVNDSIYYSGVLFAAAVNAVPDGGTATIRFFAQADSDNVVINNKTLTLIGKDSTVSDLAVATNTNADLFFSGNGGYAITLQDKATLIFQNMAVHADRPLFMYGSTDRADLAEADRDITLSFENSFASGGYASSVFMGGSGSHKCDTFTINVDATSKLMFAPGTHSNSPATMFYANYASFPNFVVNLDGALEIADKCTSEARRIWVFDMNAANSLTFTASETASISFTCNEAQAAADHALFDTNSNAKVVATIAAAAITDDNGASTLGDLYLYNADATGIPEICITHTSTALEETLKALLVKVGGVEDAPVEFRVYCNNVYYYFNILAVATEFANANSVTVEFLNAKVFADVAAAIAGGAYFRLGGEVVNGTLGTEYFENLSALMDYVATQSMTDITVYVLQTATDGNAVILSGIKMTLDSVDSTQQTLTMTATPAFNLDADAHLVVKNVKIVITNAFAQVTNADTTKMVQLDLESGAYIDITNTSSSQSTGYFFKNTGANKATGIVTVNVKAGATINRVTATATSGGGYGLFFVSPTRGHALSAAGSSVNVNGTINFGLTYSGSGYAPVFMWGDKNLTLNINDGATIDLCHKNASSSIWGAIVCMETSGTINIGNATLKAANNLSLLGVNGSNVGATVNVTGATFTAENFPFAVVNEYGASTQKITFTNCSFTCKVSANDKLSGVVLDNVAFPSDAHAGANYGVKVSGLSNYYSLGKAIELIPDGGTITVLGNCFAMGVEITDKSLTIQGADATNRPVITNSGDGSSRILTCYGNCNVTLQDLEINAKGRAFNFLRYSYVDNETEATVYVDTTDSSLSLYNSKVYGVACGANHNSILIVGDGKGTYGFNLYIDKFSSMGYLDGDSATIKSTRDYQVIFYYASVTGDIVIEGEVCAYVYFTGDQVNYEKVKDAWTSWGPNSQHMIQIGGGSSHIFTGDFVLASTAKITHKVIFPAADENGDPVRPEDYPSYHSAYAIYMYGANAGVFVADGATITLEYENEYQQKSKAVGFGGTAADYNTTWNDGATTGRYHYYGVGALLAFLNNNAYKNNKITVATSNGSSCGIVYNANTFVSGTVEEDTGIAGSGGHDYYGAIEIAALLAELTGNADIAATTDATETTYEIAVGIVNRTIVQTYLPQLEMNEYAIIIKDGKILILAWHEAALNKGVAAFKYALSACTDGTTLYLPNLDGICKFVANESWINDFTKPANGTLWGGQYVNDNSLQYVYSGYADAAAGHAAINAYCAVLESEGYELVWQNVIENNLFRMYKNTESGVALYVAYNDYTYKDKYYGTNGDDGLYGEEETDYTEIPTTGDLNDEYFENRDHRKVLRVVSMPLSSVTLPDAGINAPDFSYDKVTNTLQTTLSFRSTSVGLGHVYMLEDGRFLVVDGGGSGFTNEGDVTEPEAIWQVMNKMYQNVYGKTPEENGDVIHIAAWYLTHAHWDHHTAFTDMLKAHGQELKMDYMIGSYMANDSTYRNHGTSFTPASWQQYVNGGFKYVKVYTGQKLYLANLEIEVLMTYMDHAPFRIINSNDSNTVTRFSIRNQDAMNGVTAQVLYLGDSWRHSSRILTEMYDSYLQTEIVQLAHHGNIGCERVLYKAIAPRAVFFSHDVASFKSYVYFDSFSAANQAVEVTFRYAANVWCAYNAEYMWSAPYGTYNVLEFLPARPDYENIYELGIQPSATAGAKITNQYDTDYKRTQSDSNKKSYIHNEGNGYKSVNVVWGDLSFTYDAGVQGSWNAETHTYDGAVAGEGWVANGNNRIWVGNASTGSDQSVNVQLGFTPASGCDNFTGIFKHNGEVVAQNTGIALASKEYKEFEFFLDNTALPREDLDNTIIGNVTVTLK